MTVLDPSKEILGVQEHRGTLRLQSAAQPASRLSSPAPPCAPVAGLSLRFSIFSSVSLSLRFSIFSSVSLRFRILKASASGLGFLKRQPQVYGLFIYNLRLIGSYGRLIYNIIYILGY